LLRCRKGFRLSSLGAAKDQFFLSCRGADEHLTLSPSGNSCAALKLDERS
jgi:hypothetical protein